MKKPLRLKKVVEYGNGMSDAGGTIFLLILFVFVFLVSGGVFISIFIPYEIKIILFQMFLFSLILAVFSTLIIGLIAEGLSKFFQRKVYYDEVRK